MDPDVVIKDRRSPGLWVVSVVGEMDILSVPRVRDHVLAGVGRASRERMVLDLAAVSFMDSAGLGLTIALLQRAAAAGLQVAVVVAQPEVVRLFAVMGVSHAYPVFASLEAALKEDASGPF